MDKNQLKQMADEFGVDADALQCLIAYLWSNIKSNDDLRAAFLLDPGAVLQQGVEAWIASSTRLFDELIEGKSDFAIEYKRKLAEETWNTIRNND